MAHLMSGRLESSIQIGVSRSRLFQGSSRFVISVGIPRALPKRREANKTFLTEESILMMMADELDNGYYCLRTVEELNVGEPDCVRSKLRCLMWVDVLCLHKASTRFLYTVPSPRPSLGELPE